jgi:hypothetical protein
VAANTRMVQPDGVDRLWQRVGVARGFLVDAGAIMPWAGPRRSVTKMGFPAEPGADAGRATVPQYRRWVRVVACAQTGEPGRPERIWGTPGILAGGSPRGGLRCTS